MTHPHPIPPEALPVVRRLRLEVERPASSEGLIAVLHDMLFDRRALGGLPSLVQWHALAKDWREAFDAIWPPDGRWCRACGSRPVDPVRGIVPLLHTCPQCEREFCDDCIDAEGGYGDDGTGVGVYPCRECREGRA